MKWLLGGAAVVLALAVLGTAWLLGTEPGLHWAARRAEAAAQGKLSLEGLHGALAREIEFSALRFDDDGTRIALRNGRLRLELFAILGGRAGIRSLAAESLELDFGDKEGPRATPPSLPFAVRIERADIARIRWRELLVERFELRDAVFRASGAISAVAGFGVPDPRYPAQVTLKVGGSLEGVELAVSGSVAGIPVSAKARVAPFAPRPLESLEAQAGPINLAALDDGWPRTAISLTLAGKASASSALAGTLAFSNAQPGTLDDERIPVSGAQARFSTDFTSVALRELHIALTRGGTLNGKAQLRPGGAELELQASGLDLRALRRTLRETRLAGPLRLQVTRTTQSLQGTLAQSGMSLTADVVRAGEHVEIRSLRALAEGGEATGSGRVRLGEPMRFQAQLKLAGFDPARFGDYPQGAISGSVDASGTLGTELQLQARWRIADSRLRGEAFASRGAARFSRSRVTQADAEASLGSASLRARGGFGRPGDELALELEAPELGEFLDGVSGRLRASAKLSGRWEEPRGSVQAQAAGLRLPNGVALKSVRVQAAGTLSSHEADIVVAAEDVDAQARLRGAWRRAAGWSGELVALRNAGRYPLQLLSPAPLRLAPGRVELGALEARLGEGRLRVSELAWSEARLATRGDFRGLPAQWLIVAAGLTERLRASLLLDGSWNVRAAPRLTGSVSLQRAAGDLTVLEGGSTALELEKAALEARFDDGRVHASGEVLSRFAELRFAGRIEPEPGAAGVGITARSPISFDAKLRFAEVRMLTQSLFTGARLDGRVGAELHVGGTLGEPQLTGRLNGEAIALEVPPYGVYLAGGELQAVLEGDSVRITRFSIQAGGGTLTATGTLPLRDPQRGPRLEWRAEDFRLLERPDLRLTVSGAGEATLVDGRVFLSGALRAERGYLELEQERLPQLGEDVVIIGEPRPSEKEQARLPVALDVQLDLGDNLEVRGYGLEGKLAGRLQIETTREGELRAYGRIHTVNATFLAYGHRLQVDPGVAVFDGPIDNPSLQMTAWRRNQQVEAGVQISGTARAPRVQLVSQPPVPESERLSWLVLGRPPGEATKADLGLLQAAAGALLARGDQMPLDRRIAAAFGLDEISLRGSGEVADRVVAVGKRLSDRLYVSYEQGLGAVVTALVKLDYALTQRLSVRAETGTSSGVGLFYRFSWD